MKIRKLSVLIPLFLGAVSCSTEKEYRGVVFTPDDEFSVSIDEAESVAASFMSMNKVLPSTKAEDITVKEAFSIKDKSEIPLLHIINYEGGGFAIIAGDMHLRPIQAYSPTGTFSNKQDSYPLGLRIWIESAETARDENKEKQDGPDEETRLSWLKYKADSFDLESIKTKSIVPVTIDDEPIDTLVGPFIQDSWYQGSPYNDSLLVCTHYLTDENGIQYPLGPLRPVVGCGPLAIARIMRYNRKPNTYSWLSMPYDEPQTSQTISFIRDVHYAVKSYADTHGYTFSYCWSPSSDPGSSGYILETSISGDFPIDDFLRSQYGYSSATRCAYSLASHGIMRRELIDYSLPCILTGYNGSGAAGHAWICDGYHYNYSPWFDLDGEFIGGVENYYLHHCWGWENRDYDGWFSYNNVNGLQYNMHLIHRITTADYWSDE